MIASDILVDCRYLECCAGHLVFLLLFSDITALFLSERMCLILPMIILLSLLIQSTQSDDN